MILIPYNMFNGNCEEAISFYAKPFNGTIKTLSYFEGSQVENKAAEKEEKNIFNALSDGGKGTMSLQDIYWGATFGMLIDKYGVCWMFNYNKLANND